MLTDDYGELRCLWEEYVEDKEILKDWQLPEDIELTEENFSKIDDELRMIGDSYFESKFELLKRAD